MKQSRNFLVVCLSIAVAIALFCGVFAVMGWGSLLSDVGRTVVYPFQVACRWVGNGVSGFFSYFQDVDRLSQEVESLRAENDRLTALLIDAEILKDESQWLYDYLDMKTEHEDYQLCAAEVISSVTVGGKYATRITLNKGSAHGIEAGMPVVTALGLVGVVSDVGLDHCMVKTVLDTSLTVGSMTTRSGAVGLVEGDHHLSYEGQALLGYVKEGSDVIEGDLVVTSGEGSIYPYGIPVGQVLSVSVNGYNRTVEAVIRPHARLDRLSQVIILTDYQRTTAPEVTP